jgi:hypothetical protein
VDRRQTDRRRRRRGRKDQQGHHEEQGLRRRQERPGPDEPAAARATPAIAAETSPEWRFTWSAVT